MGLHMLIDALEDLQIILCTQMLAPCAQQMEIMVQRLHLNGPGLRRLCGENILGRTMLHIDGIDIINEIHQLFAIHIVGEPAAKLGGKVILTIGKRSGTTEAGHNGAGLTADAGLHLSGDNGTLTGINICSLLQNQHTQLGAQLHKLISSKYAGLAGANDRYIIMHDRSSFDDGFDKPNQFILSHFFLKSSIFTQKGPPFGRAFAFDATFGTIYDIYCPLKCFLPDTVVPMP